MGRSIRAYSSASYCSGGSSIHGPHGDLRGPNFIVSGKRVILLDFDWGGEEGEVFYPADINMQLTWHGDVQPGALIRREHDIFMLERWVAT